MRGGLNLSPPPHTMEVTLLGSDSDEPIPDDKPPVEPTGVEVEVV